LPDNLTIMAPQVTAAKVLFAIKLSYLLVPFKESKFSALPTVHVLQCDMS